MCWKAHFFLHNNEKKQGRSETRNSWIQIETSSMPTERNQIILKKDLFNVVPSLKIRKLNETFQEKMKSDISEIKSSPNAFIFADKTGNIYKAAPRGYNRLLKDNITKSYKKSTDCLEKAINIEAKNIAKKIQLSDR